MGQALAAATASRRRVAPRPWVGAVLVPAGDPDHPGFAGATDGRTGPHAEVVALAAAGDAARGATLYVTLEPCSHHGLTPPCADAVIDAGVARVVVALTDPDPQVSGQGIERLRAAGIEVVVGVGEADAAEQLAPYLHHRRTGRPYVVLKLASSLDGRTAAPDGSSQWITGERGPPRRPPAAGRQRRHRGRRRHRARRRSRRSPCACPTANGAPTTPSRCGWCSAGHPAAPPCARASSSTATSVRCSTTSAPGACCS